MKRQEVNFAIEFFVVVAILSVLAGVALPHVNQLIGQGRTESYDTDFRIVQDAVASMLEDSVTGTLQPVGPTADMSIVQSTDIPPLILSNYLKGFDGTLVKSGCKYVFAADGTVTQLKP